MVFALTVLRGRLATVVVHITAGIRLFQYQPATTGDESATPETLRRVEYLERMILGGRLDARPRAGLRAGQGRRSVRRLPLRLRIAPARAEEASSTRSSERVVTTAPQLSDGFVLRGECAAACGRPEVKQSFAEAVAAGHSALRGGADAPARGPARERPRPPSRGRRPLRLPEPHARLDVVGLHAAEVRAGHADHHRSRHGLRGVDALTRTAAPRARAAAPPCGPAGSPRAAPR